VGQDDVVGKNGLWRSIIQSGKIPSLIFWGPPGCGKTRCQSRDKLCQINYALHFFCFSLVNVISNRCRLESNRFRFVSLSACTAGVADVRDAVAKAKSELSLVNRQTVLFIDEIHRFNKTQQVNYFFETVSNLVFKVLS